MSAARRLRPGDRLVPREFGAILVALAELIGEASSPAHVAAMQGAAHAKISGAVSDAMLKIPTVEEVMTRQMLLAELGGGPFSTDPERWFETPAAKVIRLGDGDCRRPGGEILYSRRKFELWKLGGDAWAREVAAYERRQSERRRG